MSDILLFIITALNLTTIGLIINLTQRQKRPRGATRQVLLDTSVLIDGRIVKLAKTGFVNDELLISRGVLNELQLLADGKDSAKRQKARFGLDMIAELQRNDLITVTLLNDSSRTPEGADARLLELAKQMDAWLCTLDFNLNKVAKVEGIDVLNINELAGSVHLNILPGETVKLGLVQPGQEKNQAVGYLGDGTMVVVANASSKMNQQVEVEITKQLQTDAGKMLFADLVNKETKPAVRHPKESKPNRNKRKNLRGHSSQRRQTRR